MKIFLPCQKYFNVRNVIISPAVLTGQLKTTSSPFCAIKVGISEEKAPIISKIKFFFMLKTVFYLSESCTLWHEKICHVPRSIKILSLSIKFGKMYHISEKWSPEWIRFHLTFIRADHMKLHKQKAEKNYCTAMHFTKENVLASS